MKSLLFSVLTLLSFGLFGDAVAQELPTLEPQLAIVLSPATPEAGERVEAYLQTHTLPSQPRSITWTINGETQSEAQNKNLMQFTAGGLGTVMTIRATATTADGGSYTVQNTFTVRQLDIIVDSNTTVPGFYQGRPEPTIGSEVKLVALLKGAAASGHSYTWKLNNKVLNGGPVRGGYTETITLPLGKHATIALDVHDGNNTLVASKSMRIDASDAEIVFYEDNPLRGMMTKALHNNSTLLGSEITIRAMPYFLNRNLSDSQTHREWRVNNRTIASQNRDQNTITLERANTNRFQLNFHIRNLSELLQGAKETISLSF